MAVKMEVEILSTQTIKPSSPTPEDLRTYKLSLLDQIMPPVFSKLLYFFPPHPSSAERSKFLKESLPEVLTRFYPFAGRIKGNFSINCNDDGVVFVEARARGRLGDVLMDPEDEVVRRFLPIGFSGGDEINGFPILVVQTTSFQCGGLAVGLLFFHKLADSASMGTFVSAWGAAARGVSEAAHTPELSTAASLFPPKDFLAHLKLPIGYTEKISTKRFVFDAAGIAALKAKMASGDQKRPPTRVEVVSSLIWKCATKASRSNSPEKNKKPSVLFQTVNLRRRFDPPLPENSTGNIIAYYPVEYLDGDSEVDLKIAVEGLRGGLAELCEGYVMKLQGNDGSSAILERMKVFERGDADTYTVTSWCRSGIVEADFGWGKPAWASTAYLPFKNIVVLMEGSGGGGDGIEAWVSLKDDDMAVFQRDQELLAYASVDPPIVNVCT